MRNQSRNERRRIHQAGAYGHHREHTAPAALLRFDRARHEPVQPRTRPAGPDTQCTPHKEAREASRADRRHQQWKREAEHRAAERDGGANLPAWMSFMSSCGVTWKYSKTNSAEHDEAGTRVGDEQQEGFEEWQDAMGLSSDGSGKDGVGNETGRVARDQGGVLANAHAAGGMSPTIQLPMTGYWPPMPATAPAPGGQSRRVIMALSRLECEHAVDDRDVARLRANRAACAHSGRRAAGAFGSSSK